MNIPHEYYAKVPVYKTLIRGDGMKVYIKSVDNVREKNETADILITEKNGNKEFKKGVPTQKLLDQLINEKWKTFKQPVAENTETLTTE